MKFFLIRKITVGMMLIVLKFLSLHDITITNKLCSFIEHVEQPNTWYVLILCTDQEFPYNWDEVDIRYSNDKSIRKCSSKSRELLNNQTFRSNRIITNERRKTCDENSKQEICKTSKYCAYNDVKSIRFAVCICIRVNISRYVCTLRYYLIQNREKNKLRESEIRIDIMRCQKWVITMW